jgi:radical SAM-linked protein
VTAARPQPGQGPDEVVQRLRLRFARRGRLRFTSHRDVARALERALRQVGAPVAFSGGFTRHPRISYVGAAPTGAASEAEYLEIGLAAPVDPGRFAAALDAALPAGLDVVEVVAAAGGSLPERIDASRWRIELPGVDPAEAGAAVEAFLATQRLTVKRLTKEGRRELDARAAVVSMSVAAGDSGRCAIIDLVVRHSTPTVRPDDVLAGLLEVAALRPPVAPRATRLTQGLLGPSGEFADPLAADRGGPAADGRAQP